MDANDYAKKLLDDDSTANEGQKKVLRHIKNTMATRQALNAKMRAIQSEVEMIQKQIQQSTGALDAQADLLLDLKTPDAPEQAEQPPAVEAPPQT